MTAKEHLADCEKRSGGATSKERELCAALEENHPDDWASEQWRKRAEAAASELKTAREYLSYMHKTEDALNDAVAAAVDAELERDTWRDGFNKVERERDNLLVRAEAAKLVLAQMKKRLEKVAMDCGGGLVDGDVVADEIRAILKGATKDLHEPRDTQYDRDVRKGRREP